MSTWTLDNLETPAPQLSPAAKAYLHQRYMTTVAPKVAPFALPAYGSWVRLRTLLLNEFDGSVACHQCDQPIVDPAAMVVRDDIDAEYGPAAFCNDRCLGNFLSNLETPAVTR